MHEWVQNAKWLSNLLDNDNIFIISYFRKDFVTANPDVRFWPIVKLNLFPEDFSFESSSNFFFYPVSDLTDAQGDLVLVGQGEFRAQSQIRTF